MKVGIDKIGFYIPKMYLDMVDLAEARGIDSAKFTIGLGQEKMAVAPLYEDAVTLAVNASLSILDEEDREKIDMVLVGSESGVDQSKAIATYVVSLAKLSSKVRVVELKQACYGATMGLQMARNHVLANPVSRVLVVATDIAKYGLNTPGEATQGAGAVAMIVSTKPRIAEIEPIATYHTEDIMDFWRPNYSEYAFADGKFSTEKYLSFFDTVWCDYQVQTGQTFADFAAICFHQPFTKLGLKALRAVCDKQKVDVVIRQQLEQHYEWSKTYNKQIGNIYTGSLYLSLISLLEHAPMKSGHRIGLFSYGSGAVGEFFVLKLRRGFKNHLQRDRHQQLLTSRKRLSIDEYEAILESALVKDGSTQQLSKLPKGRVVLKGIEAHQRRYRISER